MSSWILGDLNEAMQLADDVYEGVLDLARDTGPAYAAASVAYVCGCEFEVEEDCSVVKEGNVVLRFFDRRTVGHDGRSFAEAQSAAESCRWGLVGERGSLGQSRVSGPPKPLCTWCECERHGGECVRLDTSQHK